MDQHRSKELKGPTAELPRGRGPVFPIYVAWMFVKCVFSVFKQLLLSPGITNINPRARGRWEDCNGIALCQIRTLTYCTAELIISFQEWRPFSHLQSSSASSLLYVSAPEGRRCTLFSLECFQTAWSCSEDSLHPLHTVRNLVDTVRVIRKL